MSGLSGWTIYDHPPDWPDHFVARRWVACAGKVLPTTDVLLGATLGEVRAQLLALIPRRDLAQFTRAETDEPKIVETWL